jgi:hypothetical protein
VAAAVPAAATTSASPAVRHELRAKARRLPLTRFRHSPMAQGENPPGRVTQEAGQSGYVVPIQGTDTVQIQATVTLPSINCTTGSSARWGNVYQSFVRPGVFLFTPSTFIQLSIQPDCAESPPLTYFAFSTLDPSCSNGVCPLEPFSDGPANPGDVITLQATLSPTSSSVTATDETTGGTVSFTGGGLSGPISAGFLDDDVCVYPTTAGENCNDLEPSSAGVPPGFGAYSTFTWSNVEINGTGLGAFLDGADSAGWQQFNSVWSSTLLDQTSYVNGGDSFTVTNADLTLPSVTIGNAKIDEPSTGTGVMTFPVTLSASSSNPIYLDYATQDHSASAGTNYDAASGVLTFSPGETTQDINVTILSGASSGGVINFYLNLTNPSYAVGSPTATGTIYLGPYVESVTPTQVPLNGGPNTTVTVNGEDFVGYDGNARVTSVKFCLQSTPTSCATGTSVSVANDGQLTVTAPDASGIAGQGQATNPTDTIATNVNGVTSPANPPGDVLNFGCTQQTVPDGAWLVSGCLTDEQNSNDVTQQASSLDGVDVSAAPTNDVDYQASSVDVTSQKPVTVSLPVAGNPLVAIFKGKLNKTLSQPVSFTVPKNTMLAGLAISGTVTLTPGSPGQASGTVTVTLPPVLGGGTGTLTFETQIGGSLSNVTVTVPKANFMQLFALSNFTLSYSTGGAWKVSGTASTGGNTSTKFSGSLTYANNTLKSASLTVDKISLAGLLDISKLTVKYNGSAWSGSATVAQGKQTGTVSLTFSGSPLTLTAAELKTGPVALFGIVNVNSFDMTYGGGSWSLKVTSTLSGGGTASAALTVSNGVISSASLTLTKFALANTVTIATATVSYAASQPNSQCKTVTGTEIWCGAWDISFPDVSGPVIGEVSGSLAFQNGSFASGSVTVNGSVPLIDGVFLTQLGATLTVNPSPATVSGTATITFGPKISGVSALSATGTLTRTFPSGGTGGSYNASATVTALPGSSHSLVLGTVTVTVPDSGATTADLILGGSAQGLTVSVGSATATIAGEVKGTFTSSTFSLSGTTMITVPVLGTLSGTLKADNTGVASCGKTSGGTEVGFEYYWTTGAIDVFDSKGCSEHGF